MRSFRGRDSINVRAGREHCGRGLGVVPLERGEEVVHRGVEKLEVLLLWFREARLADGDEKASKQVTLVMVAGAEAEKMAVALANCMVAVSLAWLLVALENIPDVLYV